AQQAIAVSDKVMLTALRGLHEAGVYSIGVSFGLTQKLFLSAFEYAWAPFYYANAREPGAKQLYSTMTTYGLAVLALMTAGLSAIAYDLLALATHQQAEYYVVAAGVVTWISVGVLFQGAYLLTSIGLNITGHSKFYPVATLTAATSNIAMNLVLIPRFGMIGAAWANAIAYGLQAVIAYHFSQRFYPIEYERGRIALIAVAALGSCFAARQLPDMAPLAGVLARGTTVVVLYASLLGVFGFLRRDELEALSKLRRKRSEPRESPGPEVTELGGEIVAADMGAEGVMKERP
ncbi:MAG TPA: lipopolysaccharide biosynthesis protein, partial [Vicinamibacterales bacterium]|nr:lipopolysaccharide biosynthesis protein [Vicinamibacterales bacterium]